MVISDSWTNLCVRYVYLCVINDEGEKPFSTESSLIAIFRKTLAIVPKQPHLADVSSFSIIFSFSQDFNRNWCLLKTGPRNLKLYQNGKHFLL